MINRITNNLDTYAKIAFPKALEVSRSQKHVSLILDRKGNVLSSGNNDHKQHTEAARIGYRFDELHAELDALLRLHPRKRDAGNLILFNFRFNRFGDFRMSRPCAKCMPWCSALFKRIIYTTRHGYEVVIPYREETKSIEMPLDKLNMKGIMQS